MYYTHGDHSSVVTWLARNEVSEGTCSLCNQNDYKDLREHLLLQCGEFTSERESCLMQLGTKDIEELEYLSRHSG